MNTKVREDILGLEYDWLALDKDGQVGLFTTAGGGRAPSSFFSNTEAHDAGLDALIASPSCTPALFYPELRPGLDNIWKMAAERGVYAFDSDPNGAPYRLVAAPQDAVISSGVPIATAVAARGVVLDYLLFAQLPQNQDLETKF